MGINEFFEKYLEKRKDAISISKISERGYILLNKTEKFQSKILKLPAKSEAKHISKVKTLQQETKKFTDLFGDKYNITFDENSLSNLNNFSIRDLKDCKEMCQISINLSKQARKQTLLISMHIGLIYLLPLEIILSIPLLVFIYLIIV